MGLGYRPVAEGDGLAAPGILCITLAGLWQASPLDCNLQRVLWSLGGQKHSLRPRAHMRDHAFAQTVHLDGDVNQLFMNT